MQSHAQTHESPDFSSGLSCFQMDPRT